jgi:hypothetical protein
MGVNKHYDDFQPEIEALKEHGIEGIKVPHPDDK